MIDEQKTPNIDEDRARICWLGFVLPKVERKHIKICSSPLTALDRFEIIALIDPPTVWPPDFHTVMFSSRMGHAHTANLPEELDLMPYGDERLKAVRSWHKRLWSACYAEIFGAHPHIYDKVMQEVGRHYKVDRITYPPLWSDGFVKMIGDGTLGDIQIEGLIENGYITVPREWL